MIPRGRGRHCGLLTDFGAAAWRAGALGIAVLPLLAGCAPGGNLAMLPQPANETYRLGTGDQIRVITYDEPQLSNVFTVGDDGTIAFPLVGNMPASGMTGDQLSTAIAAALERAKLLNQPSVSVQVVAYRPISVLGLYLSRGHRLRRGLAQRRCSLWPGGRRQNRSFIGLGTRRYHHDLRTLFLITQKLQPR
jgi:Polysaccharide biosynthesis/export protein